MASSRERGRERENRTECGCSGRECPRASTGAQGAPATAEDKIGYSEKWIR